MLSQHDSYVKGLECIALKITNSNKSVNLSITIKFFIIGLYSETCVYEVGIISNRKSARYGEIV